MRPPIQNNYFQQHQMPQNQQIQPLQSQFHMQNQFSSNQQHQYNQPQFYCWTHGVTTGTNHTSLNCRNPAPGHQPNATYFNALAHHFKDIKVCFYKLSPCLPPRFVLDLSNSFSLAIEVAFFSSVPEKKRYYTELSARASFAFSFCITINNNNKLHLISNSLSRVRNVYCQLEKKLVEL